MKRRIDCPTMESISVGPVVGVSFAAVKVVIRSYLRRKHLTRGVVCHGYRQSKTLMSHPLPRRASGATDGPDHMCNGELTERMDQGPRGDLKVDDGMQIVCHCPDPICKRHRIRLRTFFEVYVSGIREGRQPISIMADTRPGLVPQPHKISEEKQKNRNYLGIVRVHNDTTRFHTAAATTTTTTTTSIY